MILRYFLILTLPVLASCTFPWSSVPVDERTFESDYAQVMSTQFSGLISGDIIEKINTLYAPLYPSGHDTSSLRLYYGEETTGSGDITITADATREGWKHLSADISITGGINTPRDTLSLDDIRGSFIVRQPSEFFMRLDNFEIGGSLTKSLLEEIGDITPYLGKWYYYDQFEIMSLMMQGTDTNPSLFFQMYMSFLRDMMTNGLSSVEEILAKHPPFFPLSVTGTLSGDRVNYPVRFDPERAVDGVLAFVDRYGGTGGLSEKQKESLASFMGEVSGTGIFSLHQDDPGIHSFSGIFTDGTEIVQVLIDSTHDKKLFHFWNEDGGLRSLYEKTPDDIITYALTIEEKGSPLFSMSFSGEFLGGEKSFAFSIQEQNEMKLDLDFSSQGREFALTTLSYESGNDPVSISFSGTLDGDTLVSDLSMIVRSGENIITGRLDIDDDHVFTGSLMIPAGEILIQGHARGDDIRITGTALGMSASFSHIRDTDGTWKGNMTFPVGNMTWNGQTQKGVLRDFHFRVNSPIMTVSTDLIEEGPGVRGPFRITAQGEEVLTGTLMLERRPKILNLRIDTMDPTTMKPLYLGFESMTDIRWSDDARVTFPDNPSSLVEVFSGILISDVSNKLSNDLPDQYLND